MWAKTALRLHLLGHSPEIALAVAVSRMWRAFFGEQDGSVVLRH